MRWFARIERVCLVDLEAAIGTLYPVLARATSDARVPAVRRRDRELRFAATLEFLRAIDYVFPAWAEEYMAPAADVRGYVAQVKSAGAVTAYASRREKLPPLRQRIAMNARGP